MNTGYFASPAAATFLNAFQADAFQGRMQIPTGLESGAVLTIGEDTVDESQLAEFRQMSMEVTDAGNMLGKIDTPVPIVATWSATFERDEIGERVLFKSSDPNTRWNEILIQESSFSHTFLLRQIHRYGSRSMSYLIPAKGGTSPCKFKYSIGFHGLAHLGLREYLGLSKAEPLINIIEGLARSLGKKRRLRDADPIIIATKLANGREVRSLGDLKRDGDAILEQSTHIVENLPPWLRAKRADELAFLPLPQDLHPLWHFAASDTVSEPDEDLAYYLLLTRSLYSPAPEGPKH